MVRYRTKRNSAGWLDTPEFAKRAGISRQAASKALRRAAAGMPWNGFELKVRETWGRGGTSGKSWQVKLTSLPTELRDA